MTKRHKQRVALLIINASLNAPGDGLEIAQQLHQLDSSLPVIVITTHSSEELAIAALRAGIADYFKPPFSFAELLASVQRCLADRLAPRAAAQPTAGTSATCPTSDCPTPDLGVIPMIGEGPAMHELKTYLARVAATDATVLITGETGTGKKLVANYIHRYSHRHQKPLVDINCAAIPDSLYVNAPAWRISFSDLPELFRARCQETAALPSDERIQLLAALSASNWNKSQAAQKLHWSRVTLYRKMWRYGIVSKGDTKKDRAKS